MMSSLKTEMINELDASMMSFFTFLKDKRNKTHNEHKIRWKS